MTTPTLTYEHATQSVAETKESFSDPEFPATNTTIGPLTAGDNVVAGPGGEIVWKRAQEFITGTPCLFETISPTDILQGTLGDCYLLSAISVLAEKPERIRKLFVNQGDAADGNGVYAVRMVADGVPKEIVIPAGIGYL